MQAHRAVGHRLYRLGRYEEAVAAFRRAYEVKADARLLFDIAECYREMGAVDQALFYYDRYLAGWPDAFDRAEVEEKVAELEAMRGGTAPRTAVAARRRHPLMIVEPPPSKPRQTPRAVAALVVLDGGRRRRAGRRRRRRRVVVRIGDVGAGDGPRQQEVLLKRALGTDGAARGRARLPPRPERGVADRRDRVGHAADGRVAGRHAHHRAGPRPP